MHASMSKRRRPAGLVFPYGKSLVASCGLLAAVMCTLAAIADPATGAIRPPAFGWILFSVLVAGIAAAFYVESRSRNRRRAGVSPDSNHWIGARRLGRTREGSGPGKC